MRLFDSVGEAIGWIVAILIVVAMGVIVFTGPYNKVNKSAGAGRPTAAPAIQAKIENDPKTVGKYVPTSVTVHVGQDVTFSNVSSVDHTVTARDNSFDSGDIGQQVKWTLVAKKAGTFPYFCIYHPNMHGTLVVQP